MSDFKIVNGKKIKLTAKEIKERDAKKKAWDDEKVERNLGYLRSKRNDLLAETDYMGLADVTMSAKWKTYRQELRDITKKFKSLGDKDFKFPEKPKD